MNPYYNATGTPIAQTRGASNSMRSEFSAIAGGFDNFYNAMVSALSGKGAVGGQTWTGTHSFPATTYGVTAAVGSSGNAFATLDYVNAQAFSAALPAQTGNSGKFLTTNGSSASWASITGGGGTAITDNVTLTSSSAGAMTITPTGFGLGATLPDATTCSKGIGLYSAFNAGDFDYSFSNKAGTKLGFLLARGAALFGLSDNSTIAGSWVAQGLSRLGITAAYKNNTLTNSGDIKKVVQIDATRQFILFGGTTVYGIVYDSSQANPWGSVLTIRTGAQNGQYTACLSGAAQILVVSCDTTTGIEAVTITLTGGTGATLNSGTKATATLASNNNTLSTDLVAVGTGFAFGYSRTGNIIAICGVSISGTTPTIGAEQALSPASSIAPLLFVSGSTLRAVAISTTALACKPFTISGAVLTPGTEASVVTTSNIFRCFMNGNGNIVAQYLNGNSQATVFKLTGTVEAASTVQLSATVTWSALASTDYAAISASKTCFILASGSSYSINILTDTAGTASVGTQVTFTTGGTVATVCAAPVSGNTARFIVSSNSDIFQAQVDCSAASPTLTNMYNYGSISSGTYAYPQATDSRGKRNNITFISNGNVCGFSAVSPSFVSLANGGIFSNPSAPITGSFFGDPTSSSASWVSQSVANTSFYKIEAVL